MDLLVRVVQTDITAVKQQRRIGRGRTGNHGRRIHGEIHDLIGANRQRVITQRIDPG